MKGTTRILRNDRRILIEDFPGEPAAPVRAGRPARDQRRRILLAEDDGEGRRLLRQVLREEGHRVVAVRDGLSLLGEVAATLLEGEGMPFDLIIAEQRLPGVSGMSVLTGLRQCAWTTPFILITAAPDGAIESDARRLEGAVLPKPFDLQALRAAVTDSANRWTGIRGA
jgi:DNA-binding response OmpR family regulator